MIGAVAKTTLISTPPFWSSNELIAIKASGAGLVNTVEFIVKVGLATGAVSAALALFSVTMTAVLQSMPRGVTAWDA